MILCGSGIDGSRGRNGSGGAGGLNSDSKRATLRLVPCRSSRSVALATSPTSALRSDLHTHVHSMHA
jgi:hypothetical protein